MTLIARLSLAFAGLALIAACTGTGSGPGTEASSTETTSDGAEILGRIGDREITEADLVESTPVLFAEIRRKAYDLVDAKEKAANQFLINEMIAAEAAERGVTPQQLFESEVQSQVPLPSEEEISSFYEINKQYARGRSLDELRPTIVQEIRRPQVARAQARFLRQLREKYDVEITVEPIRVDYDLPDTVHAKGAEQAPVTIVEFADYQCPSCKAAHPMVEQLMAEFGDRLRYVFVDYPLPNHSRAIPASIAARCAAEQGKFWEMNDNLMVIAGDFADTDLYARAENVGLDAAAFATCYQSGPHDDIVQSHLAWGQSLGINATPSFLINDRLLIGSKSFEEMKRLIEREMQG